jgi:serine/threonine protein kinase
MRKLRGREYEQYFVQCIDVHRTKVALYLVMEYCPAGSLEQFVKRHGSFPPLIRIILIITKNYNLRI